MKIKELLALLQDMDPEGTISIHDPDPEEEGIGYGRRIHSIQPSWTTAAHDANGKADILSIDLEK